MNVLVHDPAFNGQAIFRPGLFDKHQRTLPLAKAEMLDG
jgi:hypothetical protein